MSLLSHFKHRFVTLSVYRKGTKSDSFDDQDYSLNGTISGMIEDQSGSFSQVNGANNDLYSDILYTELGVDVLVNDRVKYGAVYYQVQYIRYVSDPLTGNKDHLEFQLQHINDL
jgi:hypothetical protein